VGGVIYGRSGFFCGTTGLHNNCNELELEILETCEASSEISAMFHWLS